MVILSVHQFKFDRDLDFDSDSGIWNIKVCTDQLLGQLIGSSVKNSFSGRHGKRGGDNPALFIESEFRMTSPFSSASNRSFRVFFLFQSRQSKGKQACCFACRSEALPANEAGFIDSFEEGLVSGLLFLMGKGFGTGLTSFYEAFLELFFSLDVLDRYCRRRNHRWFSYRRLRRKQLQVL